MFPNKSKCVSSGNQNGTSKNSTVNKRWKTFPQFAHQANFPWAFFLGIWPYLVFAFFINGYYCYRLPCHFLAEYKTYLCKEQVKKNYYIHNSCIGNIAAKSLICIIFSVGIQIFAEPIRLKRWRLYDSIWDFVYPGILTLCAACQQFQTESGKSIIIPEQYIRNTYNR